MASKIQLARGSLKGKQTTKKLLPSEMFWVARTSDPNNKNNEFTKWDEGTLYVGRPSLNLDRPNEAPIPIAGARTYFSVVPRGNLSSESSIENNIFQHAMVGDLYVWLNDAKDGYFHNVDDFRKDDLLLIVDNGGDSNISDGGIIIDHSLIKYVRINSSGGYADDVYFTQDGKEDGTPWVDFDATNVQDALLELNWEKLTYKGEIATNAQIPVKPTIGGLYLVKADQLTFNSGKEDEFSPDKGDFVCWRQPVNTDVTSGTWVHITSGYTNADEIDYYDHDDDIDFFISGLYSTFDQRHKDLFNNASKNVRDMLDFLMAQKAQLDEQGKIPLSQMHDTVLGSLQFRGVWNPLNKTVDIATELDTVDGKQTPKDPSIINPLPGWAAYEDGDTFDKGNYHGVNHGDYYTVQTQEDILNLQYSFESVNFELNTGDWIVFCDSDVLDGTSAGSSDTKHGFWTKIDNTDRLSAMQYVIDVQNKDNFFVTHEIDESVLTLVGTPKLKGQNKIGLEFLGNNTVAITGRGLIDQLEYEDPLPNFIPKYDGTKGTIKNSYIEEEDGTYTGQDRLDHMNDFASQAKTRFHSNLEVGNVNEYRNTRTYGDITLTPHILDVADTQDYVKSILKFEVDAYEGDELKRRVVSLVAPDGGDSYGINEDVADIETNVMLPEHTSTLVGKLAGIEFEVGRVLKSTQEGYAESSSIEEHNNDETNTGNVHDSVSNVVEFHSQVASPINQSFEYYFGDWNTGDNQGYYDNDDFDEDGNMANRWGENKILARLVKNIHQTQSNITVMLPCESGVLITEQFIENLFGSDDDTYLTMFGQTKESPSGTRINTLQKSPFRMIDNALRTRLLNSHINKSSVEEEAAMQQNISDSIANRYAPQVRDGSFKPSLERDATLVAETDIVAGVFDNDGNILTDDEGRVIGKRSVVGTNAIGVSDPEYGTMLLHGARRNYPDAEQYRDPATGLPTVPVDVVVDAPNEGGVLITSDSVISGGVW